jgi:hypothetical protein
VTSPRSRTGEPYEGDVAGIADATKWLLAAVGAVATVLVAGVQVSAFGRFTAHPVATTIALLAFAVAMVLIGRVIQAAAAVLVLRRVTVGELMRAESAREAEARGISASTGRSKVLYPILDQIQSNKGLLLTPYETLDDLNQAYLDSQRTKPDDPSTSALRAQLMQAYSFARSEVARSAFDDLTQVILGPIGFGVVAAIVVMAATLSWPTGNSSPEVSEPTHVRVWLTGSREALRDAGLPRSCGPGIALEAVAVGGTWETPRVVTTGQAGCPIARLTVDRSVGVAVPEAGNESPDSRSG